MSKYLDEIYDSTEQLRIVAANLQYLAHSFSITGNEVMSEKLIDLEDRIINAEERILSAVRKEIDDSVRETQDRTGEIMNAALDNLLLDERQEST